MPTSSASPWLRRAGGSGGGVGHLLPVKRLRASSCRDPVVADGDEDRQRPERDMTSSTAALVNVETLCSDAFFFTKTHILFLLNDALEESKVQ